MTHTPGPWVVQGSMKHTNSIRKALGIGADFAPLGMVDVSKTLDAIDAERAELLAALRIIDGMAERLEQDGYLGDGDVIAIRAAIAKATGDRS